MNANKVADTILSWDTDDELSDEEEIFFGVVRVKVMMTQTPSLLYLLSACWAEMAFRGNAPIQ